jgi:hypothetical protein
LTTKVKNFKIFDNKQERKMNPKVIEKMMANFPSHPIQMSSKFQVLYEIILLKDGRTQRKDSQGWQEFPRRNFES